MDSTSEKENKSRTAKTQGSAARASSRARKKKESAVDLTSEKENKSPTAKAQGRAAQTSSHARKKIAVELSSDSEEEHKSPTRKRNIREEIDFDSEEEDESPTANSGSPPTLPSAFISLGLTPLQTGSSSSNKITRKSTRNNIICVLSTATYQQDCKDIASKLTYGPLDVTGDDSMTFQTEAKLSRSSFYRLERNSDFVTQENYESLYASEEIIDFYNQWCYRGENKGVKFLPTSTLLFENVKTNSKTMPDKLFCRGLEATFVNKHDIFGQHCISVSIHANKHFSRAFIMNPGQVTARSPYKERPDESPQPCVLFYSSFEHEYPGHDPSRNYATLRIFCNRADKRKNGSGGKNFKERDCQGRSIFPWFELKGGKCFAVEARDVLNIFI